LRGLLNLSGRFIGALRRLAELPKRLQTRRDQVTRATFHSSELNEPSQRNYLLDSSDGDGAEFFIFLRYSKNVRSPLKIPYNPQASFAQLEEAVLLYWEKHGIFEKTLNRQSSENKKRPQFNFYDGPPFATGLPHYGHILAMTIKDMVTRYKTMRGYYVPRRAGWDCHGLPVEYELEKELGIKNRTEIVRNVGIETFNKKAREIVLRYTDEWVHTMRRMGRWIATNDAYRSMDPAYVESVWWVFKQIYDKGLVYEGQRSMPYCPRCGTPLSNFETNLGYRDNVSDPSVFVKFKIKNSKGKKGLQDAALLVWTTTPWTLPANAALAVSKEASYCLVELTDKSRVLVEQTLAGKLAQGPLSTQIHSVTNDCFKGEELVGIEYEPLFDYLMEKGQRLYVGEAPFVSLEEGTGIVHVAPSYGQDDFEFGASHHLPLPRTVNDDGTIVGALPWKGMWFKQADKEILKDLKQKGALVSEVDATIKHTYPFCWRCETPLYYVATSSWFVAVSKIKDRLVDLNKTIHWVPEHLGGGRFGKWLEEARDWAISRRRFWGAPIPIWRCSKCADTVCIGSMDELRKRAGKIPADPHRPFVDEITFPHTCGGMYQRVEDVFDCWFESGSMPYAQWHYPFENKETFQNGFPADFIAEGLDQTRGWFYTLHVIGAILMESSTYKNVIVNGLVLAEDGRKLSKRLRNYVEPKLLFDQVGADALRLFLMSSTTLGEDYRFSEKMVRDMAQNTLRPLWNTLIFYKTFLQIKKGVAPKPHETLLDRWIISRLNETVTAMTGNYDRYHLDKGSRLIAEFVDDLTNWYLRRSRRRLDEDFSKTLLTVLQTFSSVLAPITPFIAEVIYQATRTDQMFESVHLAPWPGGNSNLIDSELENKMSIVRSLVTAGLAQRASHKVKVRQPLLRAFISGAQLSEDLCALIRDELNVLEVSISSEKELGVRLDFHLTPELVEQGTVRDAIRAVQEGRRVLGVKPNEVVGTLRLVVPEDSYNIVTLHRDEIAQVTNIKKLAIEKGSTFSSTEK